MGLLGIAFVLTVYAALWMIELATVVVFLHILCARRPTPVLAEFEAASRPLADRLLRIALCTWKGLAGNRALPQRYEGIWLLALLAAAHVLLGGALRFTHAVL